MTRGRDDDALSWGDDDPTLDVGASDAARDATLGLPDGFHAVGRGSDGSGAVAAEPTLPAEAAAETEAESVPDQPAQIGNAALILLGVFGGVYLLYAIGWLIGGLRLHVFSTIASVPDAAYYSSLVLAVAAPLVWFVTVYLLTRGSATWLRVVWLLAGVVLLVPWPFLMVGAVGS